MSFSDDIRDDLDEVFYDEFSHVATIGGQSVKGFFTEADSRFMDAATASFDAKREDLNDVKRGTAISVVGRDFLVVDVEFLSDRIVLKLG